MRPRLVVEPEAAKELDEAVAWYVARGQGLGRSLTAAVRLTFEAIEANPDRFSRVRDEIRRAVVPKFPYSVFYVVESDRIAIIAIMHSRRDPRRWQTRR